MHELLDKIVVHAPTGKGASREQQVDLYFNFVGQLDIPLSQDELDALAAEEATKIEERKAARRAYQSAYQAEKKAKRYAANEGHKFAKRVCPVCGAEYWPNGNKQLYCSKECAYSVSMDRIHEKARSVKGDHTFRERICEVCGKPFWPANGRERLCSKECKHENRKKRQLEYYYRTKASKADGETCKNENDVLPAEEKRLGA